MKNLADTVLDYLVFLNCSEEDIVDFDTSCKMLENLSYEMESVWSDEERQALQEAATRSLQIWLAEPDEHGFTPRKLLTPEMKAFLEAIAAGRFDGSDEEDEE